MTREEAQAFADAWIAAWNAHDLERILSHYADDFEMASLAIVRLTGEPSGVLRGKDAVAAYWSGALGRFPELHFTLRHVLRGPHTVTLVYDGVLGVSAEVFHFGDDGRVVRAYAHYDL